MTLFYTSILMSKVLMKPVDLRFCENDLKLCNVYTEILSFSVDVVIILILLFSKWETKKQGYLLHRFTNKQTEIPALSTYYNLSVLSLPYHLSNDLTLHRPSLDIFGICWLCSDKLSTKSTDKISVLESLTCWTDCELR